MNASWDERVAAFWHTADDTASETMLQAMRSLVDERPENDPDALYEWASVHDWLGRENDAVPLYRAALDNGLSGPRRAQGMIQLASSLRNIGQPKAAVELLRQQRPDETTGEAASAFLALALRDAGHLDEALRVALLALSRMLPMYSRVIENYTHQLSRPVLDSEPEAAGAQRQAPAGLNEPATLTSATW